MSTPRTLALSGSPFEVSIGFSRGVRVGNHIFVSGTAPIGEAGETVGIGDIEVQTRRCFQLIAKAIGSLGGTLNDVVRTRMMLTDISLWEGAARVHGEIFGSIRPAATCVEVSRLIDPEWLIEIEADALVV